jgi:putative phage-type endonuclease
MSTPKIINLVQRSPEWLAWRRGEDIDGPRITATDIPVIMLESAFATPYELWLKKTGRGTPIVENWAMRRGTFWEPHARRAAELKLGIEFEDVCVEHPDVPWAAGSLDGLSILADTVLEIKVPGAESHAMAILGQVPPTYYGQLQWQLMCVPTAERNWYASFVPPELDTHGRVTSESQIALVEVLPDPEYQERAYMAAEAFRECVLKDVPPCGEVFLALASSYDQLRQQSRHMEERLAWIEEQLKAALAIPNRQIQGGGITVTRSTRKGAIDMKAYLKARGITVDWDEADLFRGASTDTVALTYRPNVAIPVLREALKLEALPAPEEPKKPRAVKGRKGAKDGDITVADESADVPPEAPIDSSIEAALLV